MELVRTGLRQIMSDLLRARPAEEAVLLAWPLVCGKEVAARSQAVSFTEGKLVVEVADTTWRNQLQSFAPRYINSYQELLGPLVRSVEFRNQSSVSMQQSATQKHSAISTQQSAPKRPAGTTKTSETQRNEGTRGKTKRTAE
jgi:Dna[CI] antecedent, DciA